MIDDATAKRVLGLVGLGLRGRLAVLGVDRVREAAQKGTLELALVGSDASENSLDKVVPLLRAKGVRIVQGISAAALGGAAGKEATAVIGIVDANLAKGIRGIVDAVEDALEMSPKAVVLHITSPGGEFAVFIAIAVIYPVVSSLVLYGAIQMRRLGSLGWARAAVILLAGTKGKRYALPSSTVMIHQAAGGFEGTAADIESILQWIWHQDRPGIICLDDVQDIVG